MAAQCKHEREIDKCKQCKIEALSTDDLLIEVEAYNDKLYANGFIAQGWWIELANRLRSNQNDIRRNAWLKENMETAYAALDAAFPEFKFAGINNGIKKLAEQRDEARAEVKRLQNLLRTIETEDKEDVLRRV